MHRLPSDMCHVLNSPTSTLRHLQIHDHNTTTICSRAISAIMTTKCYGIDGTPYATSDRYIPCNTTAAATGGHTSCCAPGDNCLSNGLCQNQYDNKRKANIYWRNGCTDSSWNDPSCPRHCEGLDKPDSHAVFFCLQADSWCCPTGKFDSGQTLNTTCCTKPGLTFSATGPLVYTVAEVNMVSTVVSSIQKTTSTPVSQSSIATTSQPSQAPSATPSPNTSSSTDQNMGVKIGVPLGIALAIAIGVIALLALRSRKSKQPHEKVHSQPIAYAHYSGREHVPASELSTRPEEMPAGRDFPAELEDARRK
ncbi:hypothetical protein GQ44DRAFT_711128 [Phaeosphaeriaceae sp. PMI808]|nr:hypothetical protein GQ44DRAFT_711128 [Phaeosphaeriaceae sp. PMI808]